MPRASFSAAVLAKKGAGREEGEKASLLCGPWGADDVEFMISANTGEPLKELARIASGGELSRVMLAVKTILSGGEAAEQDLSADTLVFDEIDTGIGGEVALAVGEYLSRIGGRKQIFCVTHLASIAVRADNHFKVEKKVVSGGNGERTVTGVIRLEREERRQEIARMLAGDSGAAALAHADELLAKYGRS
jgi:DNA repair protein RecN (Recombination protein N)